MNYPGIILLVIEEAKNTYRPKPFILDPDWLTPKLYMYQSDPDLQPMSETDQDAVWLAESIKPRPEWNITKDESERSSKLFREKRLSQRKKQK